MTSEDSDITVTTIAKQNQNICDSAVLDRNTEQLTKVILVLGPHLFTARNVLFG